MKDSKINGKWLEVAFKAAGLSAYRIAKELGYSSPNRFYNHISGTDRVSADTLGDLARAYPQLNIRYILTGEGSPLL